MDRERSLEVLRKRSTGELFIQAFWEKPMGGATFQGHPLGLPPDVSDETLGEAILSALRAYSTVFDPSQAVRFTEGEYQRLLREHDVVSVERWPSGETIIVRMQRSSGGLEGTRRRRALQPGASIDDIVAAIRIALGDA